MSVRLSIVLDKRRIKKTNKYPVKLRVTFDGTVKYFLTVFDLSKEDYEKLPAKRVTSELQEIRKKLEEIETTARSTVRELDPFVFAEFEKDFIFHSNFFKQKKRKQAPDSNVKANRKRKVEKTIIRGIKSFLIKS